MKIVISMIASLVLIVVLPPLVSCSITEDAFERSVRAPFNPETRFHWLQTDKTVSPTNAHTFFPIMNSVAANHMGRRLSHRDTKLAHDHSKDIEITIVAKGISFSIRLERNEALLRSDFIARLTHHTSHGKGIEREISRDIISAYQYCHYHGTVTATDITSGYIRVGFATLSTCSGLLGEISLDPSKGKDREIFHIKPVVLTLANGEEESTDLIHDVAHKMFLAEDSGSPQPIYPEPVEAHHGSSAVVHPEVHHDFLTIMEDHVNDGLAGKERRAREARRRLTSKDTSGKEVGVLAVVDHILYDNIGGKDEYAIFYTMAVFNNVASLFKRGNFEPKISVVLSEIHILSDENNELWKRTSKRGGFADHHDHLKEFRRWHRVESIKGTFLNHDQATLLTGLKYPAAAGVAYLNSMCTFSSVTTNYGNADNFISTGIVVAHELMHNLGGTHDKDPPCGNGCSDPTKQGIMGTQRNPAIVWSQCTYKEYAQYISSSPCLNDVAKVYKYPAVCGDGSVDGNEECDPGKANDPCCTSECKWAVGAECSDSDACCNNCKRRTATEGHVCRDAINSCDVAETCNGKSTHCPNDIVKFPGTRCTGKLAKGDGACYQGECMAYKDQCERLVGPGGSSGELTSCPQQTPSNGNRDCGVLRCIQKKDATDKDGNKMTLPNPNLCVTYDMGHDTNIGMSKMLVHVMDGTLCDSTNNNVCASGECRIPGTISGDPQCGNGVVEEGEQCDCLGNECTKPGADICCDGATCTFTSKADCSQHDACCDVTNKNQCSRKQSCSQPAWVATEWGVCDRECGTGFAHRKVTCQTNTSTKTNGLAISSGIKNIVDDNQCVVSLKPLQIKRCTNRPCGSRYVPKVNHGQLRLDRWEKIDDRNWSGDKFRIENGNVVNDFTGEIPFKIVDWALLDNVPYFLAHKPGRDKKSHSLFCIGASGTGCVGKLQDEAIGDLSEHVVEVLDTVLSSKMINGGGRIILLSNSVSEGEFGWIYNPAGTTMECFGRLQRLNWGSDDEVPKYSMALKYDRFTTTTPPANSYIVSTIMNEMDTNFDWKVQVSEFQAYYQRRGVLFGEDRRSYDFNGDGIISTIELKVFISAPESGCSQSDEILHTMRMPSILTYTTDEYSWQERQTLSSKIYDAFPASDGSIYILTEPGLYGIYGADAKTNKLWGQSGGLHSSFNLYDPQQNLGVLRWTPSSAGYRRSISKAMPGGNETKDYLRLRFHNAKNAQYEFDAWQIMQVFVPNQPFCQVDYGMAYVAMCSGFTTKSDCDAMKDVGCLWDDSSKACSVVCAKSKDLSNEDECLSQNYDFTDKDVIFIEPRSSKERCEATVDKDGNPQEKGKWKERGSWGQCTVRDRIAGSTREDYPGKLPFNTGVCMIKSMLEDKEKEGIDLLVHDQWYKLYNAKGCHRFKWKAYKDGYGFRGLCKYIKSETVDSIQTQPAGKGNTLPPYGEVGEIPIHSTFSMTMWLKLKSAIEDCRRPLSVFAFGSSGSQGYRRDQKATGEEVVKLDLVCSQGNPAQPKWNDGSTSDQTPKNPKMRWQVQYEDTKSPGKIFISEFTSTKELLPYFTKSSENPNIAKHWKLVTFRSTERTWEILFDGKSIHKKELCSTCFIRATKNLPSGDIVRTMFSPAKGSGEMFAKDVQVFEFRYYGGQWLDDKVVEEMRSWGAQDSTVGDDTVATNIRQLRHTCRTRSDGKICSSDDKRCNCVIYEKSDGNWEAIPNGKLANQETIWANANGKKDWFISGGKPMSQFSGEKYGMFSGRGDSICDDQGTSGTCQGSCRCKASSSTCKEVDARFMVKANSFQLGQLRTKTDCLTNLEYEWVEGFSSAKTKATCGICAGETEKNGFCTFPGVAGKDTFEKFAVSCYGVTREDWDNIKTVDGIPLNDAAQKTACESEKGCTFDSNVCRPVHKKTTCTSASGTWNIHATEESCLRKGVKVSYGWNDSGWGFSLDTYTQSYSWNEYGLENKWSNPYYWKTSWTEPDNCSQGYKRTLELNDNALQVMADSFGTVFVTVGTCTYDLCRDMIFTLPSGAKDFTFSPKTVTGKDIKTCGGTGYSLLCDFMKGVLGGRFFYQSGSSNNPDEVWFVGANAYKWQNGVQKWGPALLPTKLSGSTPSVFKNHKIFFAGRKKNDYETKESSMWTDKEGIRDGFAKRANIGAPTPEVMELARSDIDYKCRKLVDFFSPDGETIYGVMMTGRTDEYATDYCDPTYPIYAGMHRLVADNCKACKTTDTSAQYGSFLANVSQQHTLTTGAVVSTSGMIYVSGRFGSVNQLMNQKYLNNADSKEGNAARAGIMKFSVSQQSVKYKRVYRGMNLLAIAILGKGEDTKTSSKNLDNGDIAKIPAGGYDASIDIAIAKQKGGSGKIDAEIVVIWSIQHGLQALNADDLSLLWTPADTELQNCRWESEPGGISGFRVPKTSNTCSDSYSSDNRSLKGQIFTDEVFDEKREDAVSSKSTIPLDSLLLTHYSQKECRVAAADTLIAAIKGNKVYLLNSEDGSSALTSGKKFFEIKGWNNDAGECHCQKIDENKKIIFNERRKGSDCSKVECMPMNYHLTDVAISPRNGGQLYVSGYNYVREDMNRSGCHNPATGYNKCRITQVPFIKAFSVVTGNELWHTWDYTALDIYPNYYADALIRRIEVKGGLLFAAGETRGSPMSVFRFDGMKSSELSANGTRYLVKDSFSDPMSFITKKSRKGFIHTCNAYIWCKYQGYVAHIDEETGEVKRSQFLIPRQESGEDEAFRVQSLAVDDDSRTFVGGVAFYSLPAASVASMNLRANGSNEQGDDGDPVIAVLSTDMKDRLTWYSPRQTDIKPFASSSLGTGPISALATGKDKDDRIVFAGANVLSGELWTGSMGCESTANGNIDATCPTCDENGQSCNQSQALASGGLNSNYNTKNDAYGFMADTPPLSADYTICNPLDYHSAPPPKMEYAKWHRGNTRPYIDILFDTDTDKMRGYDKTLTPFNFLCSKLFSSRTSYGLGIDSKCTWISSSRLKVYVSLYGDICKTQFCASEGFAIKIREGRLWPLTFQSKSSTASVNLTSHKVNIAPRAKLVARGKLKPCPKKGESWGGIGFDASSSLGGSSIRPLSYKWLVTFANNTPPPISSDMKCEGFRPTAIADSLQGTCRYHNTDSDCKADPDCLSELSGDVFTKCSALPCTHSSLQGVNAISKCGKVSGCQINGYEPRTPEETKKLQGYLDVLNKKINASGTRAEGWTENSYYRITAEDLGGNDHPEKFAMGLAYDVSVSVSTDPLYVHNGHPATNFVSHGPVSISFNWSRPDDSYGFSLQSTLDEGQFMSGDAAKFYASIEYSCCYSGKTYFDLSAIWSVSIKHDWIGDEDQSLGLHPDVRNADKKVHRIAAETTAASIFFPRDLFLAGRAYTVTARIWRTGLSKIANEVHSVVLKPRFRPLDIVMHGTPTILAGDTTAVVSMAGSSDPDWRTDRRPLLYNWKCKNILQDTHCLLNGYTTTSAGDSAKIQKNVGLRDKFPREMSLRLDSDNDGIGNDRLAPYSSYLFTGYISKTKKLTLLSAPDRQNEDKVTVISNDSSGNFSATLKVLTSRKKLNANDSIRIRGSALSMEADVIMTFAWRVDDVENSTDDVLLPSPGYYSVPVNDKAYFTIAPGTLQHGQKYKLTLTASERPIDQSKSISHRSSDIDKCTAVYTKHSSTGTTKCFSFNSKASCTTFKASKDSTFRGQAWECQWDLDKQGCEQYFDITNCRVSGASTATSTVIIEMNTPPKPPKGGTVVTPKEGVEFSTFFEIDCGQWPEASRYQVYWAGEDKVFHQLTERQIDSPIFSKILPFGRFVDKEGKQIPLGSSTVIIQCRAWNASGAMKMNADPGVSVKVKSFTTAEESKQNILKVFEGAKAQRNLEIFGIALQRLRDFEIHLGTTEKASMRSRNRRLGGNTAGQSSSDISKIVTSVIDMANAENPDFANTVVQHSQYIYDVASISSATEAKLSESLKTLPEYLSTAMRNLSEEADNGKSSENPWSLDLRNYNEAIPSKKNEVLNEMGVFARLVLLWTELYDKFPVFKESISGKNLIDMADGAVRATDAQLSCNEKMPAYTFSSSGKILAETISSTTPTGVFSVLGMNVSISSVPSFGCNTVGVTALAKSLARPGDLEKIASPIVFVSQIVKPGITIKTVDLMGSEIKSDLKTVAESKCNYSDYVCEPIIPETVCKALADVEQGSCDSTTTFGGTVNHCVSERDSNFETVCKRKNTNCAAVKNPTSSNCLESNHCALRRDEYTYRGGISRVTVSLPMPKGHLKANLKCKAWTMLTSGRGVALAEGTCTDPLIKSKDLCEASVGYCTNAECRTVTGYSSVCQNSNNCTGGYCTSSDNGSTTLVSKVKAASDDYTWKDVNSTKDNCLSTCMEVKMDSSVTDPTKYIKSINTDLVGKDLCISTCNVAGISNAKACLELNQIWYQRTWTERSWNYRQWVGSVTWTPMQKIISKTFQQTEPNASTCKMSVSSDDAIVNCECDVCESDNGVRIAIGLYSTNSTAVSEVDAGGKCTTGKNKQVCKNGGSPIGSGDICRCSCLPGYRGDHCETALKCNSGPGGKPCGNKGVVTGTTGNCTCDCSDTGYEGTNCNAEKTCTLGPNQLACKQGQGEPTGTGNKCTCKCNDGYEGDHCQTAKKCTTGKDGKACLNNSIATGLTGNCSCDCKGTGFEGLYCQTAAACTANKRGKQCVKGQGKVSGFTGDCKCECEAGFEGDECQTAKKCTTGKDGKACLNNSVVTGVTGNCGCKCIDGYEGLLCEIAKKCLLSQNGKECVKDQGEAIGVTGSCTCKCKDGFQGDECENFSECTTGKDGKACLNNSIATGLTGNCSCDCKGTGFEGLYCQTAAACTANKNGTQCVQGQGNPVGFTGDCRCECNDGYEGDHCQTAKKCTTGKDGKACLNNSIATGLIGNCSCDCKGTGFEGLNCQTAAACTANKRGKQCVEGQGKVSGFTGDCKCDCEAGFEGDECQTAKKCTVGPNNHPCTKGQGEPAGTGKNCTCKCMDGYEGDHCETAQKCLVGSNGEKCVKDQGTASGLIGNCTCQCKDGFEGANCESKVKSPCSLPQQFTENTIFDQSCISEIELKSGGSCKILCKSGYTPVTNTSGDLSCDNGTLKAPTLQCEKTMTPNFGDTEIPDEKVPETPTPVITQVVAKMTLPLGNLKEILSLPNPAKVLSSAALEASGMSASEVTVNVTKSDYIYLNVNCKRADCSKEESAIVAALITLMCGNNAGNVCKIFAVSSTTGNVRRLASGATDKFVREYVVQSTDPIIQTEATKYAQNQPQISQDFLATKLPTEIIRVSASNGADTSVTDAVTVASLSKGHSAAALFFKKSGIASAQGLADVQKSFSKTSFITALSKQTNVDKVTLERELNTTVSDPSTVKNSLTPPEQPPSDESPVDVILTDNNDSTPRAEMHSVSLVLIIAILNVL